MRKAIRTLRFRLRQKSLRRIAGIAIALLMGWLLSIAVSLSLNAKRPVDAILVLGGSVQREIYAAQLAKQNPELPILISSGSDNPCIQKVFQQLNAPMQRVWLEKCATSTFDNFCFSLPTLRQWNTHKVRLITSKTHLPRAKWLAHIMLGAHRLWVETEIVQERGIPGNRESLPKTVLDVTRGLAWTIASQVHAPHCSNITRLSEVNSVTWGKFKCERLNPAKSAQSFDSLETRSFHRTS